MSIAERIIKKREELGLSQTELANRAGLKPPAISQYESSSRNPSYEALIKLSNALNVTTDFLISGKEIDSNSINDQSIKMLLKIADSLSIEDRDKLVEYAVFLVKNHKPDGIPVLNTATDYANYVLKNIYKDKFPVDVEEIAKLFNITIYFQKNQNEFEGILIKGNNKLIIIDATIDYRPRIKFTIATLIGHAIIPWHAKSQYNIRKSGTSTLLTNDIEKIEAQNFAASLIMPRNILEKDINKINTSLNELKKLASEKYDVSLTALLNRLVEFNKDRCAVVFSKNFNITSMTQGNRPLTDKINPYSKAATFFNNPSQLEEIRSERLPATFWFQDAEPNEVVFEQSIYNPKYNGVITLLILEE